MSTITFRKTPLFRFIALTVLTAFVALLPAQPSYAQVAIIMPPPGVMIHITRHFEPPQMVGLKVDLKDPFNFNFIMDQGETPMPDDVRKEEFNKIIKYFLVSLAMPNKDMWVNLSPYESKRIIPEVFAQTEMGRDLLAQDYILKQFTASLMYPEDGLGRKFWDKVYAQAQARFGTTEINVNTFNKVWIVADHADVYQKDDTAFLVRSHLKVMLEQDYMAIEKNKEQFGNVQAVNNDETRDAKTQMASQLVREIIIPAIEKEVNEGKSFAAVRQVYNAEIMATWFKKTLRESLLGQVFANKGKISGQRVSDPQAMEKIYQQYLRAYKKGVFNYIREDATPDGQTIPRKYFSGGFTEVDGAMINTKPSPTLVKRVLAGMKSKSARMVLVVGAFIAATGIGQKVFAAPNAAAATTQSSVGAGTIKEGTVEIKAGFHGKLLLKGTFHVVKGTGQVIGKAGAKVLRGTGTVVVDFFEGKWITPAHKEVKAVTADGKVFFIDSENVIVASFQYEANRVEIGGESVLNGAKGVAEIIPGVHHFLGNTDIEDNRVLRAELKAQQKADAAFRQDAENRILSMTDSKGAEALQAAQSYNNVTRLYIQVSKELMDRRSHDQVADEAAVNALKQRDAEIAKDKVHLAAKEEETRQDDIAIDALNAEIDQISAERDSAVKEAAAEKTANVKLAGELSAKDITITSQDGIITTLRSKVGTRDNKIIELKGQKVVVRDERDGFEAAAVGLGAGLAGTLYALNELKKRGKNKAKAVELSSKIYNLGQAIIAERQKLVTETEKGPIRVKIASLKEQLTSAQSEAERFVRQVDAAQIAVSNKQTADTVRLAIQAAKDILAVPDLDKNQTPNANQTPSSTENQPAAGTEGAKTPGTETPAAPAALTSNPESTPAPAIQNSTPTQGSYQDLENERAKLIKDRDAWESLSKQPKVSDDVKKDVQAHVDPLNIKIKALEDQIKALASGTRFLVEELQQELDELNQQRAPVATVVARVKGFLNDAIQDKNKIVAQQIANNVTEEDFAKTPEGIAVDQRIRNAQAQVDRYQPELDAWDLQVAAVQVDIQNLSTVDLDNVEASKTKDDLELKRIAAIETSYRDNLTTVNKASDPTSKKKKQNELLARARAAFDLGIKFEDVTPTQIIQYTTPDTKKVVKNLSGIENERKKAEANGSYSPMKAWNNISGQRTKEANARIKLLSGFNETAILDLRRTMMAQQEQTMEMQAEIDAKAQAYYVNKEAKVRKILSSRVTSPSAAKATWETALEAVVQEINSSIENKNRNIGKLRANVRKILEQARSDVFIMRNVPPAEKAKVWADAITTVVSLAKPDTKGNEDIQTLRDEKLPELKAANRKLNTQITQERKRLKAISEVIIANGLKAPVPTPVAQMPAPGAVKTTPPVEQTPVPTTSTTPVPQTPAPVVAASNTQTVVVVLPKLKPGTHIPEADGEVVRAQDNLIVSGVIDAEWRLKNLGVGDGVLTQQGDLIVKLNADPGEERFVKYYKEGEELRGDEELLNNRNVHSGDRVIRGALALMREAHTQGKAAAVRLALPAVQMPLEVSAEQKKEQTPEPSAKTKKRSNLSAMAIVARYKASQLLERLGKAIKGLRSTPAPAVPPAPVVTPPAAPAVNLSARQSIGTELRNRLQLQNEPDGPSKTSLFALIQRFLTQANFNEENQLLAALDAKGVNDPETVSKIKAALAPATQPGPTVAPLVASTPESTAAQQASRSAMLERAKRLANMIPAEHRNQLMEMWQKTAGTHPNKAMTNGGINLSDENLTIDIKVDGKGMPLPQQYQDAAMRNINGLTSIIRRITPLTPQNVPALYELVQ